MEKDASVPDAVYHWKTDDTIHLASIFLEAVGTPVTVARRVARHLIDAEIAGHPSHGVLQAIRYLGLVDQGLLVPAALPAVVRETPTTALVDGNWGFGFLAGDEATSIAVRLAKKNGVSLVGVSQANHFGRLGAYAERAADRGVALLVLVGGLDGPRVAAHGAKTGLIGPNALAAGFPAGDDDGLIVDMATSMVASGVVELCRTNGKLLPEASVLGPDGVPTRDPNVIGHGGAHRPFGGPKGSAIGLLLEMLGRVMLGTRRGAAFIGIDTGVFADHAVVARQAHEFLGAVRALSSTSDVPVRTPGQRHFEGSGSDPDIVIPAGTLREFVEQTFRLSQDQVATLHDLLDRNAGDYPMA